MENRSCPKRLFQFKVTGYFVSLPFLICFSSAPMGLAVTGIAAAAGIVATGVKEADYGGEILTWVPWIVACRGFNTPSRFLLLFSCFVFSCCRLFVVLFKRLTFTIYYQNLCNLTKNHAGFPFTKTRVKLKHCQARLVLCSLGRRYDISKVGQSHKPDEHWPRLQYF